jgi:hypothetical protein
MKLLKFCLSQGAKASNNVNVNQSLYFNADSIRKYNINFDLFNYFSNLAPPLEMALSNLGMSLNVLLKFISFVPSLLAPHENLAKDKQSSLLCTFINYDRNVKK